MSWIDVPNSPKGSIFRVEKTLYAIINEYKQRSPGHKENAGAYAYREKIGHWVYTDVINYGQNLFERLTAIIASVKNVLTV